MYEFTHLQQNYPLKTIHASSRLEILPKKKGDPKASPLILLQLKLLLSLKLVVNSLHFFQFFRLICSRIQLHKRNYYHLIIGIFRADHG